jgi:hypothetical protein
MAKNTFGPATMQIAMLRSQSNLKVIIELSAAVIAPPALSVDESAYQVTSHES